MRKLSVEEFREAASEEIAKEAYPDFSESHVERVAERLKAQDKWL